MAKLRIILAISMYYKNDMADSESAIRHSAVFRTIPEHLLKH